MVSDLAIKASMKTQYSHLSLSIGSSCRHYVNSNHSLWTRYVDCSLFLMQFLLSLTSLPSKE
jgi:hypothetical protein